MNFSSSSQRKSWIFSQDSLYACKQQAVAGSAATRGRVQKFASGFHSQWKRSTGSVANQPPATTERTSSMLSVRDQETLVQFHAHQIQTLVGPHALVTELRRSQKVLSTAVVLFRRFFLSNSVIEFNPRKIATAAAFLAAKLEEERVEVSFRGPFLFRHGRQCLLGVYYQSDILVNMYKPTSAKKVIQIWHYLMLETRGCVIEFARVALCESGERKQTRETTQFSAKLATLSPNWMLTRSSLPMLFGRFPCWPMPHPLSIEGFVMHLCAAPSWGPSPWRRLKKESVNSWKE